MVQISLNATIFDLRELVEIEEITDPDLLFSIRKRWSKICWESEIHVPYLTYEWYRCALETIDKGSRPFILFFKLSGHDIGLVPLIETQRTLCGMNYTQISFVQNPYTPFQGFVYQEGFQDILASLMAYLRSRFSSRFYLDLDEIRFTPDQEKAFKQLYEKGLLYVHKEQKQGSRYLLFEHDFGRLISGLKKKTQKEFRRKIKRLSSIGTIHLKRIQGQPEIAHHLNCFFRFYERTWKGKEPNPEFYFCLCKEFEALGQLYFYVLEVDEHPVAYLICLYANGVMYGIKTTYDPSYYAFSPGVVLFYKCIEAMSRIPGIKEFDIGRGNEQFKREWTSLVHPHIRLYVYPGTLLWKITGHTRYKLLPKMKKSRTFDRFYTSIRARFSGKKTGISHQRKKPEYRRIFCKDYTTGPASRSYDIRFAKKEDFYRLIIATSSPNFKELRERMAKQRCLLILHNENIEAYFWLSSPHLLNSINYTQSTEVVIDDWGMPGDFTSNFLKRSP